MKFAKERLTRPFIIKTIIFAILVAILIGGAYYYGYFKKNCQQNKACFDEAFKSCTPAKLVSVIDNNYYYYAIDGSRGDKCKVRVKLTKMGIGTSQELIQALEGKEMTCYIPLTRVRELSFDTMPDVLGYCSGPLKEAIYEQIIQKMYALIIKNLGPIVSEVKEFYNV
ncbi:MAG: hypothetical protein QXR60_05145 [Candidatus Nanoarchaeia archaeon]